MVQNYPFSVFGEPGSIPIEPEYEFMIDLADH